MQSYELQDIISSLFRLLFYIVFIHFIRYCILYNYYRSIKKKTYPAILHSFFTKKKIERKYAEETKILIQLTYIPYHNGHFDGCFQCCRKKQKNTNTNIGHFFVSFGLGVNNTSEFVRNELRAVVNSRNQMGGGRPSQSPLGQGPMQIGNATNTTMSMGTSQMPNAQMINTTPDPSLGFNFDLSQSGIVSFCI